MERKLTVSREIIFIRNTHRPTETLLQSRESRTRNLYKHNLHKLPGGLECAEFAGPKSGYCVAFAIGRVEVLAAGWCFARIFLKASCIYSELINLIFSK